MNIVFGNDMNGIGCWFGSVYIFVKRVLFGWTDVGLLCMHVDFDCGFINWSTLGNLI